MTKAKARFKTAHNTIENAIVRYVNDGGDPFDMVFVLAGAMLATAHQRTGSWSTALEVVTGAVNANAKHLQTNTEKQL